MYFLPESDGTFEPLASLRIETASSGSVINRTQSARATEWRRRKTDVVPVDEPCPVATAERLDRPGRVEFYGRAVFRIASLRRRTIQAVSEGRQLFSAVHRLVQSERLRDSSARWMAGCSLLAASVRERLSQRPRLGIVTSFAIGAVVGVLVVQWLGTSRSPDRSDSSVRSAPSDIALPPSPGSVATAPVAQPVEAAATAPAPIPSRALAPPAAPNYRGELRVDSQPIGATVFVNSQPIGQTPIVLSSLPVGSRAVRLELKGHGTWSGSVRIVASQSARLSVRLERAE